MKKALGLIPYTGNKEKLLPGVSKYFLSTITALSMPFVAV